MKLQSLLIFSLLSATLAVQSQDTIDAYDSLGNTPLIQAVRNQDLEEVNQLLAKGADPNKPTEAGLNGSPLMYSVASNNVSIARALLGAGAAIDQVDANGDPAINWATYYGYVASIKFLIEKGADLNIKSKHGTPVDVGFRLWHADSVAQAFRETLDVDLPKNKKKLISAVRNQNPVLLKKLLAKDIDPNLTDELGTPIIHLASESGDLATLKVLIEAGADHSKLNRVGQSAMAIASRFGNKAVVEYLLQSGADPNRTGDEYQLTPIMAAAVNGSVEIVDMLLGAGADADHQDVVNQASALVWGLFYSNTDACLLMLDRGADYTQMTLGGTYSIKDVAQGYMNDEVVNKIIALEQANNPMIGSWKIKRIHYIYTDTTYKMPMEYEGRLIVTNNSYSIMYNPYGKERKSAETLSKLTDDEIKYAFQTLVFNSGTYELKEDSFITTADMAKVAGFEGGVQYYRMEQSEKDFTITMYDETYPSGDKPEWYGSLEVKFFLEKEL
ncbi:ankyrin repeat domain-containing protein [Ekhidna sp. To15]|uniref:ankyrin repeat domain-containing protein n=1 Tax=Ekhidna sp. To15 TaxID=3395267 RepID=UPI003F52139E